MMEDMSLFYPFAICNFNINIITGFRIFFSMKHLDSMVFIYFFIFYFLDFGLLN